MTADNPLTLEEIATLRSDAERGVDGSPAAVIALCDMAAASLGYAPRHQTSDEHKRATFRAFNDPDRPLRKMAPGDTGASAPREEGEVGATVRDLQGFRDMLNTPIDEGGCRLQTPNGHDEQLKQNLRATLRDAVAAIVAQQAALASALERAREMEGEVERLREEAVGVQQVVGKHVCEISQAKHVAEARIAELTRAHEEACEIAAKNLGLYLEARIGLDRITKMRVRSVEPWTHEMAANAYSGAFDMAQATARTTLEALTAAQGEGEAAEDDDPCHGPQDAWCPVCGLGEPKAEKPGEGLQAGDEVLFCPECGHVEKAPPALTSEAHPTAQAALTIEEAVKALEFYADPYSYRDEHGEPEPVPDFYSELEFGERARAVLPKLRALQGGSHDG